MIRGDYKWRVLDELLLQCLEGCPPFSAAAIARGIKADQGSVRKALRELKGRGFAVQYAGGWWDARQEVKEYWNYLVEERSLCGWDMQESVPTSRT